MQANTMKYYVKVSCSWSYWSFTWVQNCL